MRSSSGSHVPSVFSQARPGCLRPRQSGEQRQWSEGSHRADRKGGDGLVAARHLYMFNYKPTIYLPKPGSKEIYRRLLKQVENLRIPVIKSEADFEKSLKEQDVILDAIFGKCLWHRITYTPLIPQGSRSSRH